MKRLVDGRWLLIAGVGLGFSLMAYGIWRINQAEPSPTIYTESAPRAQPQQLTAAKRPIGRGQVIAAENLTQLTVEGGLGVSAPPATELAGRVALRDFDTGQVITRDAVSQEPGGGGLALLVPHGHRAVSLETNAETGVSDLIQPGDRVDVAIILPQAVLSGASLSGPDRGEARTLLQEIEVLAVGTTLSASAAPEASATAPPPRPMRTVTLALPVQEVSAFLLARTLGQVQLSLRHPADKAPLVAPPAQLARLRSGQSNALIAARPARAIASAPRARIPVRPAVIELNMGGERQTLTAGGAP